jgi:uncharacterized caspase-like protein
MQSKKQQVKTTKKYFESCVIEKVKSDTEQLKKIIPDEVNKIEKVDNFKISSKVLDKLKSKAEEYGLTWSESSKFMGIATDNSTGIQQKVFQLQEFVKLYASENVEQILKDHLETKTKSVQSPIKSNVKVQSPIKSNDKVQSPIKSNDKVQSVQSPIKSNDATPEIDLDLSNDKELHKKIGMETVNENFILPYIKEWETVIFMNIQNDSVSLFAKTSPPFKKTLKFNFKWDPILDSEFLNIMEDEEFEKLIQNELYVQFKKNWNPEPQNENIIPDKLVNFIKYDCDFESFSKDWHIPQDEIFKKKLNQSYSSIQKYLDQFDFVDYLIVFGDFFEENLEDFEKHFPSLDVVVMTKDESQKILKFDLEKGESLDDFCNFYFVLKLVFSNGIINKVQPEKIFLIDHFNKQYSDPNSLLEVLNKLDNNLTSVTIQGLKLNCIPEKLFEMRSLTYLNLNGNEIFNIPKEITKLINLEYLSLDYNKISITKREEFSLHLKPILSLKKLNFLSMKSNQIKFFPKNIMLNSLKTLLLCHNNIVAYKKNLAGLKNLNRLSLKHNVNPKISIEEIPGEFANFKNLKYLDLSDNKINSIPRGFIDACENFGVINLKNNLFNYKLNERFSSGKHLLSAMNSHISVEDSPSSQVWYSKKKISLCIGVNEYENLDKLDSCLIDSEKIHNILSKFGFESELIQNKNQAEILESIEYLIKNVEDHTTIVFYYSGHGSEKFFLRNFLFGIDGGPSKYIDIQHQLINRLQLTGKKIFLILILDCCRSDDFEISVHELEQALPVNFELIYIFSSAPNQISNTSTEFDHPSVFTGHLIDVLESENIEHKGMDEIYKEANTKMEISQQKKNIKDSEKQRSSKTEITTKSIYLTNENKKYFNKK